MHGYDIKKARDLLLSMLFTEFKFSDFQRRSFPKDSDGQLLKACYFYSDDGSTVLHVYLKKE